MDIRFYLNILSVISIAFFVALFQYSVISLWSYPFYLIDLIIPSLIFFLLVTKSSLAWIFATSIALILDFLYFDVFGLNLVSILVVVWLMQLWLRNWFTRHSIYSFLVLAALSVLIKNMIYYIILSIFTKTEIVFFNILFYKDMLWQVFWVVIFSTIFFYISFKINKNLKPVFLGRKPLS